MKNYVSVRVLMTAPLLLALFIGLFIAGCASVGKSPDEIVSQRAQERWDLILGGDIEGAYQYLSPGYRSGVSLQDYMKRLLSRKVKWTGAAVDESNCSSNSCKVKISVEYSVYGALPGVSRMDSSRKSTEDWLLVHRKWYFLPAK